MSETRRARHFLNNRAIRVRECNEPVARGLLRHVVDQGLEVRLLTDGTKIGFGHQLWIEEMLGDFRKHGFDLESSHLRHFLRLSRLALIVAILYVWLVAFGSQVIKCGQLHLVDRADRRDLSIIRIGLSMVERLLANDQRFALGLAPSFW